MSTPKFTFTARLRDLCAMRLLVRKDETRYAITGVNCRFVDGELFISATDGRRLGVLRAGCDGIEDGNTHDPITLYLRSFEPDLEFFEFDARASVEVYESEAIIRYSEFAWVVPVIRVSYPPLEKVLKLEPSESVSEVHLNSKFVRTFGKVEKILINTSSVSVHFRFTGDHRPVEVFLGDSRFYGIVMPVKFVGGKRVRPDWLSKFGSKVEVQS